MNDEIVDLTKTLFVFIISSNSNSTSSGNIDNVHCLMRVEAAPGTRSYGNAYTCFQIYGHLAPWWKPCNSHYPFVMGFKYLNIWIFDSKIVWGDNRFPDYVLTWSVLTLVGAWTCFDYGRLRVADAISFKPCFFPSDVFIEQLGRRTIYSNFLFSLARKGWLFDYYKIEINK